LFFSKKSVPKIWKSDFYFYLLFVVCDESSDGRRNAARALACDFIGLQREL
jgi:hypothetical protein